MEDDTLSLFRTIEKTDDKEVIVNTQTGETYTIYGDEKDVEEMLRLKGLEPRMKSTEEILILMKKYYGRKKRYSGRKKR